MKYSLSCLCLIFITGITRAQFSVIPAAVKGGDISELAVPGEGHLMLGVNYGSFPYYDSTAFYRSADDGSTWQRVKINTTISANLLSTGALTFTNTSEGYLGIGQNGECRTLHYTNDGGRTWTQKKEVTSEYRFQDIWIRNSSTLDIACGSRIARVTNNGSDWNTAFIPNTPSLYEDIDYVNPDTGFACGWYAATIARTTNGGQSWQQIYTPASNPSLYCLHFPNTDTGYAAGNNTIISTTDGGKNWTEDILPFYAFDLVCSDARTCFCATDAGVFKTGDGGKSWENIYPSSQKLLKLVLVDNTFLYASGENGILLKASLATLSSGFKKKALTKD